ncbi:pilus assembly PilX N-terminal domain-containing protein [Patescibacteria group bacterium]|nr:pilus assembly PilX N-terminal domain-containing protein [Patescibacteria group bacterium]
MLNLKKQKGFAAFFITILVLVVMMGIAISITVLSLGEHKISRNITKSNQAYYVAEAGIEDSIYRIIKGKNYQATNSLVVEEGTATISITDEDSSKVIKSSGAVSQRIRKLSTTLTTETITIAFHYGAQVDRGGLQIQPNARVVGNVYSNGSIMGSGTGFDFSEVCESGVACITGDAWVAGGVAPNPDQEWTSQDSDFSFGLKIGPVDYLDTAQSFVPSESEVLNIVSLYLKKVGEPPDQTVRILIDNGGSPSNTSLASGTLKASKVTSNYGWIDVSLDPPPSLTAGQTYWIMIDVARDDDNHWIWGKDSTDGYPLGTGKYTKDWTKSDAVWAEVGGDLNFKTWMGGIITYMDGTWVGVNAYANTITDSNITADAYYQSIENTVVYGTSYPGSPDPPTKDLPISYAQIQDWEAAAEAGGVIGGSYNPPDGSSLGPIKINGNLTFPSNGTVTIEGPVWVTGKILAENNVTIKLKEGLTSGYTIIADNPSDQAGFGQIELNNNVITQDSPQGGKLLFIATNKSTSIANPSIWLHNNVNQELAQSIILSLHGTIKVENNVKFKEITGYAIYLANNAEIVYEIGLINAGFSSGPGGGWEVTNWKEIE